MPRPALWKFYACVALLLAGCETEVAATSDGASNGTWRAEAGIEAGATNGRDDGGEDATGGGSSGGEPAEAGLADGGVMDGGTTGVGLLDGGAMNGGTTGVVALDGGATDGGILDGGTTGSVTMEAGANDGGGTTGDGGGGGTGGDNGGAADWPCGKIGALGGSSGVLMHLGNTSTVTWLLHAPHRVLSAERFMGGHWALWNRDDRDLVATGTNANIKFSSVESKVFPPALGGSILAFVHDATNIEIRSATTGALIRLIPVTLAYDLDVPFGVATDGSYVWTATHEGFKLWSSAGVVLAERNGDYGDARVFAAPGVARIAGGPAGASVIEVVSSETGDAVTSPAFAGSFHSWFVDGTNFFTNVGTTVRVYSSTSLAQQGSIVSLPTISGLTGQGSHFWTLGPIASVFTLDIYSLPETNAPAKSYTFFQNAWGLAAGSQILVFSFNARALYFIDLTDPGFAKTSVPLPPSSGPTALVTGSVDGSWALAGIGGVVFDGTDLHRALSCGSARAIVGSDPGIVAVETASGAALLFDLSAGLRFIGSVPLAGSDIDLSRDGKVLLDTPYQDDYVKGADRTLKAISVPAFTSLREWPYTFDQDKLDTFNFTMSADGSHFGLVVGNLGQGGPSPYTRDVVDLSGGPPSISLSGTSKDAIRLSEDGSLAAIPTSTTASNIYTDGVLTSVVPGYAVSRLLDDQVLANHASTSEAYTSDGIALGKPLPALTRVRSIAPGSVYSEKDNAIYSIDTGTATWSGPAAEHGTVAGAYVVFTPLDDNRQILIQTY